MTLLPCHYVKSDYLFFFLTNPKSHYQHLLNEKKDKGLEVKKFDCEKDGLEYYEYRIDEQSSLGLSTSIVMLFTISPIFFVMNLYNMSDYFP